MDEAEWLAERFEEHRPRLRAVAYRMLGSLDLAEEAVQDSWMRLTRADSAEIHNLGGWLTTVVARECLNVLRSRRRHQEEPFGIRLPDPIVARASADPEQEALLADSVGLALLVVLDSLTPSERLAFVLHDMFQLPYAEVAHIVGRTRAAARQLASRARRRVKGAKAAHSDLDLARQRQVVEAFFAAARAGDFEALVKVLDPDIVLRSDFGRDRSPLVLRGVSEVAKLARAPRGSEVHPVLVNGMVGGLVTIDGQPFSVLAFTVVDGRIVEIDGIRDPVRVRRAAALALE